MYGLLGMSIQGFQLPRPPPVVVSPAIWMQILGKVNTPLYNPGRLDMDCARDVTDNIS